MGLLWPQLGGSGPLLGHHWTTFWLGPSTSSFCAPRCARSSVHACAPRAVPVAIPSGFPPPLPACATCMPRAREPRAEVLCPVCLGRCVPESLSPWRSIFSSLRKAWPRACRPGVPSRPSPVAFFWFPMTLAHPRFLPTDPLHECASACARMCRCMSARACACVSSPVRRWKGRPTDDSIILRWGGRQSRLCLARLEVHLAEVYRCIQFSRTKPCPASCSITWQPDIDCAHTCLLSRVGAKSCYCV